MAVANIIDTIFITPSRQTIKPIWLITIAYIAWQQRFEIEQFLFS